MSLIHWWPLNGDLNNKINGKKLIQNIETSYIDGKLDKAIKFNGYPAEYQFTSEEVNALNQNKNSFSIACWIKLDSSQNGWGQIITLGDYGTDWNNIRLGLDNQPNERVWFTISNGTINMGYKCGSNSNLQDNQWHHLVGIYSNRKLTMYVDGVKQTLESTSTFDPAFNLTSYVMIGGNHNGEKPMCAIADVRVYDHTLSQAEIQELKKALVVHYTFDDVLIEPTTNRAGMLYNETGLTQPNSNTIQNMQLITDAAISRYSLKCNNTKILTPITGDISQGATLSLWINLPKDNNGNNIFPSSSEVVVADNNSQLALGFFNGAHGIITCAGFTKPMMANLKTALVNDWNHIAVIRDSNNNIKSYLNGAEYPLTDNQEWTHSEPYFSIGCRYSSSWTSYYNGQVDDVRLYNSCLSPEEIKELYNCGGRISNLGDAFTGEFIEGAASAKINKNHTIQMNEFIENDEGKASIKKGNILSSRQIIEI